jgi:hypothetical protein
MEKENVLKTPLIKNISRNRTNAGNISYQTHHNQTAENFTENPSAYSKGRKAPKARNPDLNTSV